MNASSPNSDKTAASDYQPTSRRPIADAFRNTAHWAVAVCIRWNIHPDAISYFSMVAAAAAAIAFYLSATHPWLLVVAPAFCYLRLWCNMLDGMVALESGKASWRGEILNDLPDRVSDVLIFAGVAHSGLNSPFLAYWAGMLALLTAYVGVLGQAVGTRREFSGWMSKPLRMVALHIGAWITLGLIVSNNSPRMGSMTILDWTCVLIITGCVQTIIVRLRRTMRALRTKSHQASRP